MANERSVETQLALAEQKILINEQQCKERDNKLESDSKERDAKSEKDSKERDCKLDTDINGVGDRVDEIKKELVNFKFWLILQCLSLALIIIGFIGAWAWPRIVH